MRKSLIAAFFLLCCLAVAAQQALNNDAIVKMVKAGLSDDLIVTTINSSPGAYDTSADGIIALKAAGVSDKVVAAVTTKAQQPATAITSTPSTPSSGGEPTNRAASGAPRGSSGLPRLLIKSDDQNFAVALAAAMRKKEVPVTIVTSQDDADLILQSSNVSAKQESAGSKFARCLFAYCAGIEGASSVSVQLLKTTDGSVAWAYQVRKGNGGPAGIQSLSEAIAKHLKNDYLAHAK